MTTIAFIGLGHMGTPMALNLINKGYQLRVFDIMPAATKTLAAAGATACTTAAAAAQDAEVVITMVQNGPQVAALCLADEGLFAQAKPNTLFIDCSSIDVSTSRLLHDQAQYAKLAMVDAPVSGGVKGAQAGTLTFMVGGTEADFARAQPILAAMGKKIIHAGPAGNGQVAKMCNNMLLGITMVGVSETFNLAQQLGLEAKKLFEISANSSGQCWSLTVNPPVSGLVETAPANNNFKAGFMAKMMLKDLLLSQNAAQTAGVSTPLGAQAAALYQLYVNQGCAEKDFSGIIEMLAGE